MAQALAAESAKIASSARSRFKLVFFVPPERRQAVQSAIFSTGAGKYPGQGAYSECSWATLGTGQFRPGSSANPHIGTIGQVEQVEEYRVEILCHGDDVIRNAVNELKKTHPYEEPAYEVYKLEDF